MQSNNPVFRTLRGVQRPVRERLRQPDVCRQRRRPTVATARTRRATSSRAPRSTTGRPMTIDSVVQKTAISLFVVILAGRRDLDPHPRHDRLDGQTSARSSPR